VGALLGVLLVRAGSPRALMAGLWGGYFLFGLVFARHVFTHDYYSLQFIPVVSLSLGFVWDFLADHLWRANSVYYIRATVLGLFLLALALSVVEHRATILLIAQQGQGEAFPGRYVSHAMTADYERRAEVYREIGEIVNHSPHTLVLAPDFGYSLFYHGRIDGHFLLPTSTEFGEDVNRLRAQHSPKYFIVVKRFAHYAMKVDWGGTREGRKFRGASHRLTKRARVVAEDDAYVVFDIERGPHRRTSEGPMKIPGRPSVKGKALREWLPEHLEPNPDLTLGRALRGFRGRQWREGLRGYDAPGYCLASGRMAAQKNHR
jgi:hypothetical protein